MFKPFKFIVQGIALELDDQSNIVGEQPAEPTTVYNVEQLVEYAEKFYAQVASLNGESANDRQPVPLKNN